jgi:hypothetical protein
VQWQRANRPEVERRQRNAMAPFMAKPKPSYVALSADDAATQALTPAIEWAKGYGRMSAIAQALTEATGSNVSRQMVGRWLNDDPKKRMQTNLGMGLILLNVVAHLAAETDNQRVAAESNCVLVQLRKPAPKKRTRK